jgi:hypothetical protein
MSARFLCASIQVATWSGCTVPIDDTPTYWHQLRDSPTAAIGAARVRVANLTCENFEEVDFGGAAGSGDGCGKALTFDADELVH